MIPQIRCKVILPNKKIETIDIYLQAKKLIDMLMIYRPELDKATVVDCVDELLFNIEKGCLDAEVN